MRAAALDVDGTLIPGTLAGSLPERLVDAGRRPRDRRARLHAYAMSVPGHRLETQPVADRMTELFAALLTDTPCRRVSQIIAQVWAEQRGRVFDFAGPMVAALRRAGLEPMLISGGPHELVALLAGDLGVERFRGARFASEDGLYTGGVTAAVTTTKRQVATELAGGETIDWAGSLAMGNSLADRDLLQSAGHPIVFEGSPALLALARDNAWPIADRHNLPSVLRDHAHLSYRATGNPRRSPISISPPPAHELRDAAHRLTMRLLSEIHPSGAIIGHAESRVTESALMLTLLRRESIRPAQQSALRNYLAGRKTSADPFDAAVIDSVLHGIPVTDRERLIDKTFEGAAQHSSARKKLALAAILAVVGPEPFHVDAPSDAFDRRDQATWTRLRLAAIHHLNTPAPVPPELTIRLLRMTEQGQRRGVVERQTFSHLFALLALNRVLPGHRLIREGIDSLTAGQNLDGGMPFIVSEEIFATATAGLSLARAGAPRATLLAMGDYLAAQQSCDGGWAYAEDVLQTDVDTTTHVLAFLHTLAPPATSRTSPADGTSCASASGPTAESPPTCPVPSPNPP